MEFKIEGLIGFIDDKFVVGIQENGLPETIFGRICYNKTTGYLFMSSGINRKKLLHRLIYYSENGGEYLRKDLHIHHRNGNKLDDRLENLEALTKLEHQNIHTIGYKPSDKYLKSSLSISIFKYNNLPFRVSFGLNNGCECYTYAYKDSNGVHRFIRRKHLDDLKEVVLSRDLLWLETKQEMIDLYEELGGNLIY